MPTCPPLTSVNDMLAEKGMLAIDLHRNACGKDEVNSLKMILTKFLDCSRRVKRLNAVL